MKLTQIIILNWNGWQDTLKCLESVLHQQAVRVVIWDNASTDDSVQQIAAYLQQHSIDHTVIPAVGYNSTSDKLVTLVTSLQNLGFATAVNAVVRLTARNDKFEYAWLLNNDAFATAGTLTSLRQPMSDSQVAFTGSVILDYTEQDIVQCCGVRYFPLFGVAKLQFKGQSWSSVDKNMLAGHHLDFQHGASLLVRLSALKDIGLMDERFFLYSEEHDWQLNAEERGYSNKLALHSVVYHKGSMSTDNKKHLFYYHYNRSSVLLSRKHYSLFTAMFASCMLALITLKRAGFNYKNIAWGLKGMKEGWQIKKVHAV